MACSQDHSGQAAKRNSRKGFSSKTVDKDSSLPSIYISDAHLHSESYGNPDSAMIVVLHGGRGVDYRSYTDAKDLTNEGYFICLYDQRNTGLSRRHPKELTAHSTNDRWSLGSDSNITKINESESVFLLGHSRGAMLATEYINTYPTQIAGVVLAEPGGFTRNKQKAYVQKSRQSNVLGRNSEWRDIYRSVYQFRWKWSWVGGLQTRNSLCSGYTPGEIQGMRDLIHSGVSVQQSSTRWMKMRRTGWFHTKSASVHNHLFICLQRIEYFLWGNMPEKWRQLIQMCTAKWYAEPTWNRVFRLE